MAALLGLSSSFVVGFAIMFVYKSKEGEERNQEKSQPIRFLFKHVSMAIKEY